MLYRFGPFEIDAETGELRRSGIRVKLGGQPRQVLLLLAERNGALVTRDELKAALWADGTFTDFDHGIDTAIERVRRALSDSAQAPRYIETLPRQGYRLLVPVQGVDTEPAPKKPSPAVDASRWRLIAVALLAALALTWAAAMRVDSPDPAPPLLRFTVELDHAVGDAVISPNGRYLAYTEVGASNRGVYIGPLWVHDLRLGESTLLTEDPVVTHPFWSPDSQFLAFSIANERGLGKISVAGGEVVRLCDRGAGLTGGSWSPDGESILFTTRDPPGLFEVPAHGGTPELILAPPAGEEHLAFAHPIRIPTDSDEPAFVFSKATSAIDLSLRLSRRDDLNLMLFRPQSGEPPAKLASGFGAVFAPSGHLLYRSSSLGPAELSALPYRPATGFGDPFPIGATDSGHSISVSDEGALAYIRTVQPGGKRLVWRDRSGRELETVGGTLDDMAWPRLSPDGREIAVSGGKHRQEDVWIHDASGPGLRRLTFAEGPDSSPAWYADGSTVLFSSAREGGRATFAKSTDGSGQATKLFDHGWSGGVIGSSPDGRYLLVSLAAPDFPSGAYYVEGSFSDGWGSPRLFQSTRFRYRAFNVSPDSRFVAFNSNQSGREEVYIRPFPTGAGRWQVSLNGGTQASWNPDGSEIFYVRDDTLMAVPLSTSPKLTLDEPKPLFRHPSLENLYPHPTYAVADDGRRFLLVEPAGTAKSSIQIVQSWHEEFRRP